jgi:uncharacterized protein YacL
MASRIMAVLFSVGFALVGALFFGHLGKWYVGLAFWNPTAWKPSSLLALKAGFIALGGILGLSAGGAIFRQVRRVAATVPHLSTADKVAVLVGLGIGLLFAVILGTMLYWVPAFGPILLLLFVVLLVPCLYLGGAMALGIREDLAYLIPSLAPQQGSEAFPEARPKLLDTNVVIDGRITDICRTGFVEGSVYVPEFVLEELQQIADSPDALKRNRGRRGLDTLRQMQQELNMLVRVMTEYPIPLSPADPVDVRLLKLAKELGAVVVTNDYNLNKVAQLHGVAVLNVNELANAVKPVFLPGEEMTIAIVKEGKEPNQGVGYLDDGTMVVVEGARRVIGQTVPIVVTSSLQTAAGKMIFGSLKSAASPAEKTV